MRVFLHSVLTHIQFFLISILSLSALFIQHIAYADERVGSVDIEEILLRPTLVSEESDGGHFDLSDSSFSIRFQKDKSLSAYLAFSSTLNRNLPVYYAAANKDEVGFYEAYAEYTGFYGRVRFGLIPLNYGYDGMMLPREQVFERSLIFSERIIGLRDYGISLYTENNGYYTELNVHNGEIDTPSDGRLFTTGRWGWTNDRNFRVQLSMQTGSVEGSVSSGATTTLAGVTNGESATWRHGALYAHWYKRDWNVALQFAGGEVLQNDYDGAYASNLLEVSRMFSKNFGVSYRYDDLDPQRNQSGDRVTKNHMALLFRNNDATSNLYFITTKVTEQRNEVSNDEIRLVWLVTPFAQ